MNKELVFNEGTLINKMIQAQKETMGKVLPQPIKLIKVTFVFDTPAGVLSVNIEK